MLPLRHTRGRDRGQQRPAAAGNTVVVACVVPHTGATVDAAGSARSCASGWPAYKVPRHVLLFAERDITLTGSAKIMSRELRQLAAKRLAGA
ncbi:hypothetical protein [Nocardia asiatica]|uniref:hypothetical protein n=1 Tax=Nocardia asiatica TaxID=209252 RepID=UPI0005C21568|nr:hypothetical protein [Nocardia asiatica]